MNQQGAPWLLSASTVGYGPCQVGHELTLSCSSLYSLFSLHKAFSSLKTLLTSLLLVQQSCGICKLVLEQYTKLCKEAGAQQAGVRFVKHNIFNDFDDYSDIALLYRVKQVPTFVFFIGGAKVCCWSATIGPRLLSAQCVSRSNAG